MSRSEIFRFRLTPEEQDRLEREAADRGLSSKADRIREALGWDARSPQTPPSEAVKAAIAKPPAAKKTDPDQQPGKAGIEALAKRIYGTDGVPMAVARKRAKQQLKSDS